MALIDIISSIEGSDHSPPDDERVRLHAANIFESRGIEDYEVNIVFIDDDAMRNLNETYKQRSGTTDVLSFNLSDDPDGLLEGEVYVSLPRAAAQAEEQGLVFDEEVIRLVTHGLLHLTGLTHHAGDDMEAMNEETERLVAGYFENGDYC